MACRVAERLIACFCGCSQLEINQVRKITKCSTADFLDDSEGRLLLRRYIENVLMDGDDNQTLKYLSMFEASREYTSNPHRDQRAIRACRREMEEVGFDMGFPSEAAEGRVTRAFHSDDPDTIYDSLVILQKELEMAIESSDELPEMRERLMEKIDRAMRDRKK